MKKKKDEEEEENVHFGLSDWLHEMFIGQKFRYINSDGIISPICTKEDKYFFSIETKPNTIYYLNVLSKYQKAQI